MIATPSLCEGTMHDADIRRVMAGAAFAAAFGLATPLAAQGTGEAGAPAQPTTTTEIDDDDDDDGPDLGWIGLLGLAGLAGLKRREPTVVHRDTLHTDRR
jgi:MYXO-CTERM domain-containing protein